MLAPPKGFSYMWPWYQCLCVFAIVGILLPAPAHWKAGNEATLLLSAWVLGGNVIVLANTISWRGNLHDTHPGWCDFTGFYYATLSHAIASTTLAVQWRLWSVTRARTVFISKAEKRRHRIITYILAILVPIILGVCHWIVQLHRYDIIEDVGCLHNTSITWLAFAIYYCWETLFCLISCVLCFMTIRLFLKRRSEFEAVLAPNLSNVTQDRYIRLLWLVGCQAVVHTPISMWYLMINALQTGLDPFSWNATHGKGNWNHVRYIPRLLVDSSYSMRLYLSISLCLIPFSGILFFIFFGFGEEAVRQYKWMIYFCLRPFGVKPPPERPAEIKMIRTWKDVILCRPGHPSKVGSTATGTLPQFTDPSRSAATRFGDDLDLNIDNLDFLNPEAVKQRRAQEAAAIEEAGAKRRSSLAPSVEKPAEGSTSAGSVNHEKVDLEAGATAPPAAHVPQERDSELTEMLTF